MDDDVTALRLEVRRLSALAAKRLDDEIACKTVGDFERAAICGREAAEADAQAYRILLDLNDLALAASRVPV